jgi:hypothetical protein
MNHDDIDDLLARGLRDYNAPPTVPREELWQRIAQARGEARVQAPVEAQGEARNKTRFAARRDAVNARAWLTWTTAGIAALLLIAAGISIGRWSERRPRGAPLLATAPNAATVDTNRDTRPVSEAPAEAQQLASAAPTVDSRRGIDGEAAPHTVASLRPSRASSRGRQTPIGSSAARGSATSDNLAYRLVVLQHLAGSEAMITAFRSSARSGQVDPQITRWSRDLLSTTRMLEASDAADDPVMKRLLGDLDLIITQIVQYSAQDSANTEELDLIEHSINQRGVITKLRGTLPGRTAPAGS